MKNTVAVIGIVIWATLAVSEDLELFRKVLDDQSILSISQAGQSGKSPLMDTNAVGNPHSAVGVLSVREFVLKLQPRRLEQEQYVWTNHMYCHDHADPLVNMFTAFDATLIEGQIFLCYQQGPRFSIAEVSRRTPNASSSVVSRFDLAKIPIVPGWAVLTNAVFGVTTNGITTLTARGTGDAVLVWRYQNDDWILDSASSSPERVEQRVRAQREHWVFQSNEWIRLSK